jgi:hypothetical protein
MLRGFFLIISSYLRREKGNAFINQKPKQVGQQKVFTTSFLS